MSGVTPCAPGAPSPPHPRCADGNTNASEFPAYRFHDKDPLFFNDGALLAVRNGDVGQPIPGGPAGYSGKHNNATPAGAGLDRLL